jgi:hypothetical protein
VSLADQPAIHSFIAASIRPNPTTSIELGRTVIVLLGRSSKSRNRDVIPEQRMVVPPTVIHSQTRSELRRLIQY